MHIKWTINPKSKLFGPRLIVKLSTLENKLSLSEHLKGSKREWKPVFFLSFFFLNFFVFVGEPAVEEKITSSVDTLWVSNSVKLCHVTWFQSQWNPVRLFLPSFLLPSFWLSHLLKTLYLYTCVILISLFGFLPRHFSPTSSSFLIWQPIGLLPALNTTLPSYSSSVISTLSPY